MRGILGARQYRPRIEMWGIRLFFPDLFDQLQPWIGFVQYSHWVEPRCAGRLAKKPTQEVGASDGHDAGLWQN